MPAAIATHAPLSVATAAVQPPALNFKFDSFGPRPGVAAAAPGKHPEPPRLPNNLFNRPVNTMMAATKESHDVLRLSAIVDDLTMRLRKTTDAKTQLEGQMQRVNAALVQERSAASSRLSALKAEVATVQESENKMRVELATRPAVKEVDSRRFMTSVRSALEQEETNARVADAEARVMALQKRAEALGAEVRLLEERRAAGVAAEATALTVDEVEELIRRGTEAQSHLEQLQDKSSAISDNIAQLEAMRKEHQIDLKAAKTALHEANAATTAAAADASAAKAQVHELMAEHGNVRSKVDLQRERLLKEGQATRQPTIAVTGADAPKNLMGRIVASSAQQVDYMSCCGTGVPFHFAHDAPVALTSASPQAMWQKPMDHQQDKSPSEMLVGAIVKDIKLYFTSASERHAQIGAHAQSLNTTVEAAA